MAENFLAQLPRVAKEELSENDTCIICLEEYGTASSDGESAEEAVRLPCPGGHIVGLNCISSWLSSGQKKNSCPYCRHKFPAIPSTTEHRLRHLPNHRDHQVDRWLHQSSEFRSHLVSAGIAPRLIRRWDRWFVQWRRAAFDVDRINMSPARVAREDFFRQTGMSTMPADTDRVLWSESGSGTELEPLLSALQTLYFREHYYYLLRHPTDGFHPDFLNGPLPRLTNEQKGPIFLHLRRIGAFRGVLEEFESTNERWRILRSQGYVFDEVRGVWFAYPW